MRALGVVSRPIFQNKKALKNVSPRHSVASLWRRLSIAFRVFEESFLAFNYKQGFKKIISIFAYDLLALAFEHVCFISYEGELPC